MAPAPASVSAPAPASRLAPTPVEMEEPEAPAVPSAEAPPWPGDSDEASFLADARARGEPPVPLAAAEEEMAAPGELPALEPLVARVPAEVREALDDLFRAKFTRVQRVSPSSLKS
jgi:hypothetical protein